MHVSDMPNNPRMTAERTTGGTLESDSIQPVLNYEVMNRLSMAVGEMARLRRVWALEGVYLLQLLNM